MGQLRARDPGLATLTTNELIELLPHVDEQLAPGENGGETHPAVLELRWRVEQGDLQLTDEQWKRALSRTCVVRVRERWPADEPFAVSMRTPWWLRATEIRIEPDVPGLGSAHAGSLFVETCGTASSWALAEARYQPLGGLPIGRHRLTFDVTVERGDLDSLDYRLQLSASQSRPWVSAPPPPPPPAILWRGALAFDVEVVPSIDEAVPPVRGPELDTAVRAALRLSFEDEWGPDRRPTAVLRLASPTERAAVLASVALSLDLELVHYGIVVARGHLGTAGSWRRPAGTQDDGRPRFHAWWSIEELPLPGEDAPSLEGWWLRVRGSNEGVLADWNAESRWAGELEIPLAELR